MTFAANIILVLEGGRLAYRSDISDVNINEFLIDKVLTNKTNLMKLPFPPQQLLIILKKNY